MQTCILCNAGSPDTTNTCNNCGADLLLHSTTAVALAQFLANERVKAIRVSVAYDSCPACSGLLQTYPKDKVPHLPHHGCSHPQGCRCFYEPVLGQTAIVGKVIK